MIKNAKPPLTRVQSYQISLSKITNCSNKKQKFSAKLILFNKTLGKRMDIPIKLYKQIGNMENLNKWQTVKKELMCSRHSNKSMFRVII